ncbi:type IV pilus biogenesis/stability protein PilW [Alteromonas ponticola]|uniref:Type IV pilus biogenesis/stability protein PilW n=1 Tax=Alteromonas aquimaris TaxID=2998417 RepID=A0ABT3P3K5_9ALTE|nr:type IV pilus biogenesis/stability protein PilW [Alteromonas aquimaris]MCW8107321.1 type IV pilus biogenesis/stability protein PilW [Alteromonas aquimaris]
MRNIVLALVFILTGCVSQTQPNGYIGDEFDQEKAAKTRISLGLTYLKNGNYSQAKANLDQALQYAPRLADTHYSLAYYYQLVGETQRADESYSNALKLAPRNADIANSYGAFLCQQQRYEDATEFFESALNNRQYANAAETYENMALCAQEQGLNEAAVSHLQSALNHQPSRAKSLFLLSELYIENGEWDKAKNSLRKYERVARVSAESLWLQVQIAQGQNDLATAKGFGDMLLAMFPQSPQAKAYKNQKDSWVMPQIEVTRKKRPVEPQSKTEALPVEQAVGSPEVVKEPGEAAPETTDTSSDVAINTQDTPIESVQNQTVPLDEQPLNEISQENPRFHIVQAKENLYRISLMYNLKMSTLQEWNQLDEAGAIRQGMRLWLIPPEQRD